MNERWATSICGVGLPQRDRAVAATDREVRHFLPAGAHNPLEQRNSNVAPNSASGHSCDGREHIGWVFWRASALLTASARAVLRLQVLEHVGRAFERPNNRWTLHIEQQGCGEPTDLGAVDSRVIAHAFAEAWDPQEAAETSRRFGCVMGCSLPCVCVLWFAFCCW